MKLRYPIRILIIDRSPAEAALLVAALRRADNLVRPNLIQDLDTFEDAVQNQLWDLVLIGHGLTRAPVSNVVEILKKYNCDAPVIVLEDPGPDGLEARNAALKAGVFDIVPRDEPFMLEHTVRRELAALNDRRKVNRYRQLKKTEEQSLNWLVAHSRERLAITQGDDIIAANESFLNLFGHDEITMPWRSGIIKCASETDREDLRMFIEDAAVDKNRPVQIELEGCHATTGEFPLLLDIAPVSFHGETGHRIIARSLDAEQNNPVPVSNNNKLKIQTTESIQVNAVKTAHVTPSLAVVNGGQSNVNKDHDKEDPQIQLSPPGVIKRDAFIDLIKQACTSKDLRSNRVGIIYVDVDNFPGLKKHLGLDGVETLVDMITAKLTELGPENAVIARITDDDFALLVQDLEWENLVSAFKIIETGFCGTLFDVTGRSVLVSAGAGLTGLLEDDTDPMVILERAYEASLSELRPVVGVKADTNEEIDEKDDEAEEEYFRALTADLQEAMHDGRLFPVFQPIVRLHGKPIELYEVFTRLRNKQGEEVPPRQFLDAAENAGIGIELNIWLIERVMEILAEQQVLGRYPRLLVKVTDQALRDVRVPLAAGRAQRKYKVSPDQIVFEVCERVSVNQVKATRTLMHAMRGMKFGTAIEHFGVTRKPFRLLKHLPIDYLTLDASIVNHHEARSDCAARVRRIVDTAHEMGKLTCAEYVDDPSSVAMLYKTGIDFVQGHYIQPPAPELDFEFSMMVG